MGSPLAPILSDISLEHLFDSLIPQFPDPPDFLYKYVDDTICSLPPPAVETILFSLNSFHSKIKFTMEMENDGILPFLDVQVIRRPNNTIATNWYSKPTSAGTVLNYISSHPHHQKMNVATNLAKRVLELSDKEFHKDNINKITTTLLKSNYPINIINKAVHKARQQLQYNSQPQHITPTNFSQFPQQQLHQQLQQHHQQQQRSLTTISNMQSPPQPACYYSSLTYIPSLSDNIKYLIKNNNPETKIAFQPNTTLKRHVFSNPKQKIDKLKQSNVVYKIDCVEDQCNTSYIGETKRKLELRTKEHERDYRNRFLPTPKTGLINHSLETGHQFDFNNVQILDRETIQHKRRIIESAHVILNSPNTCNLKQDTNNINNNYLNTLSTFKSISPKYKNCSHNPSSRNFSDNN